MVEPHCRSNLVLPDVALNPRKSSAWRSAAQSAHHTASCSSRTLACMSVDINLGAGTSMVMDLPVRIWYAGIELWSTSSYVTTFDEEVVKITSTTST